MTYSCYTLLMTGDLLNAVVCPFTTVMGLWFYALMVMAAMASMYIKNGNGAAVAVFGIISGITMTTLLPVEVHQVAYIIIAFAVTGILYKAFKSR